MYVCQCVYVSLCMYVQRRPTARATLRSPRSDKRSCAAAANAPDSSSHLIELHSHLLLLTLRAYCAAELEITSEHVHSFASSFECSAAHSAAQLLSSRVSCPPRATVESSCPRRSRRIHSHRIERRSRAAVARRVDSQRRAHLQATGARAEATHLCSRCRRLALLRSSLGTRAGGRLRN